MGDIEQSIAAARQALSDAHADAEAKRRAHADANTAAWGAYHDHQYAVAVTVKLQAELDALVAAQAADVAADGLEG